MRDDDLYKFLQDLKRPSPVLKRLKCIRGTLKLDISVAPEQSKHCYTPELAKLIPFPVKFSSLPSTLFFTFHFGRKQCFLTCLKLYGQNLKKALLNPSFSPFKWELISFIFRLKSPTNERGSRIFSTRQFCSQLSIQKLALRMS